MSITQYRADHEGYKVASNDLPVGLGNQVPAQPIPVVPAQPIPVVSVQPIPVVADAAAADPTDDTIQVENVEYRAKRSTEQKPRNKRSTVLPNGVLADTAEVAEAKAAHFAEHAKRSPYFYAPLPYSYSPFPFPYAAYPYNYSPTVVTPEGYLADTPEVAAAKAVHFAEHAIARSRARRDIHTPASTSPLVPVVVPAPAVVPVSGYAPGYTATVYSRPVDPSVPIVPLAPVPVTTIVKSPAEAYAYKV